MEGGWLVHPVRSYALDALYPTGQRRDGLWDGLLAVEARPPPPAPPGWPMRAVDQSRINFSRGEWGAGGHLLVCAWVTPRHPIRRSGKLSVQKRSKAYFLPSHLCAFRNEHPILGLLVVHVSNFRQG